MCWAADVITYHQYSPLNTPLSTIQCLPTNTPLDYHQWLFIFLKSPYAKFADTLVGFVAISLSCSMPDPSPPIAVADSLDYTHSTHLEKVFFWRQIEVWYGAYFFSTGFQSDIFLPYNDVLTLLVLDTSIWRLIFFHETAKRSPEGVNLVGSLCYLYNASEEDVSSMVLKLNKMIEDLLKSPPSEISSRNIPQISGINSGAFDFFLYRHASNCIITLYLYLVLVGHAKRSIFF